MASLRKFPRSPFFFACFTAPDGRRVQRSTKEVTRKAAQAKADEWEAFSKGGAKIKQAQRVMSDMYKIAHGEDLPSAKMVTFFQNYLTRRRREVTPATYEAYELCIRNFVKWLGQKAERALGELTTADVLRFRDAEAARVSASTVNKNIKILRMILEDARRGSLIAENPAKDVRTLKVSENAQSRRGFSLDEVRAILRVAEGEWRSMVLFGLYTGQRLADIAKLTWDKVDLENDVIRMRATKTGRVVNIPIAKPLQNHIASLPAGDDPKAPIHPRSMAHCMSSGKANTLSRQFSRILADAGLLEDHSHEKTGEGRAVARKTSSISYHSLRHTTTSWMKNAGAPGAVVMDIVGHESTAVSQQYTHIDHAAKQRALDSMPDVTAVQRGQKML